MCHPSKPPCGCLSVEKPDRARCQSRHSPPDRGVMFPKNGVGLMEPRSSTWVGGAMVARSMPLSVGCSARLWFVIKGSYKSGQIGSLSDPPGPHPSYSGLGLETEGHPQGSCWPTLAGLQSRQPQRNPSHVTRIRRPPTPDGCARPEAPPTCAHPATESQTSPNRRQRRQPPPPASSRPCAPTCCAPPPCLAPSFDH